MTEPPLVVDVDGTLLRSDLLLESFWAALSAHPLRTVLTVARTVWNRARLKAALAELGPVDVTTLPIRDEVLDRVTAARAAGRPVILASGSDERLVRALSDHLGLEEPIGSDGSTNRIGKAKEAALVARFGRGGFDYIGDSAADLPVWQSARQAIAVAPGQALQHRIAEAGLEPEVVGRSWRRRDLVRGLRPHQWVKNVLLFLPLIAAHVFEPTAVLRTILGIAAFSAAASAVYLINDLLDLEADRQHETKRKRAFAAGTVPIKVGMATAAGIVVAAFLLALALSPAFAGVLAVYAATSLAYSLVLKRRRWIDLGVLSGLYSIRIFAGAVVTGLFMSPWLIAFALAAFLSLAAVKRLTELAKAEQRGIGDLALPGREYRGADRRALLILATLAAGLAVGIVLLYTGSETAVLLYPAPIWIPITATILGVWFARMIVLGWHGRQDYDPVVFALRDPVGLGLALLALVAMLRGAAIV
ncbi:MAG: UbiA family prenyltransferase [Pseudomonadota bacterium]